MSQSRIAEQESQYKPDRKLARYKRSLDRSKMAPNRKEQALARFKESEVAMTRLVEAALGAFDALPAPKRLVERRSMSGLARSCFARTRKEPRDGWLSILAGVGVHYLERGVAERSVQAALAAVYRALDEAADLVALDAQVRVLAARAQERRAAPAVASTDITGASGTFEPDEFAAAINDPTSLELVQRKTATEALRQALAMLRPWAKQCVVERLARNKSYDQIAREVQMSREEVAQTLAAARKWVEKYTNFFSHDRYWRDTATQQ